MQLRRAALACGVVFVALGALPAVGADPAPDKTSPAAAPESSSATTKPPKRVRPAVEPVVPLADPKDLLARFPPFKTTERIPTLEDNGYYPCTTCHDDTLPSNPKVRELVDDHDDIPLAHGGGRYWCLSCHDSAERDSLVSIDGKRIDFNQPFLLCGQCHFDRQKDYFLGGHGKRIDTWQGEKVLAVCTDCHNPHAPKFEPRKPAPPPKVRAGLPPPGARQGAHPPIWKRQADGAEH